MLGPPSRARSGVFAPSVQPNLLKNSRIPSVREHKTGGLVENAKNVLKDGEQRVKVIVRSRPFLEKEVSKRSCLDVSNTHLEMLDPRNKTDVMRYQFDSVYGELSKQSVLFKREISPSLETLFQGQNVTVFAYGMTGSGKTYTMQGSRKSPGIIPRSVTQILDGIEKRSNADTANMCSLCMSYLEIYNDKAYDLLEPKSTDLPLREDQSKNIIIPNLAQVRVSSVEQFQQAYDKGCKNRKTASTKLNSHSSRSHAVLLLRIQYKEAEAPYRLFRAKLHLIDLAGSEDNRKTGNSGDRMVESNAINSSLFVLGKVINALNNDENRIPYRDSKLTRLLQDSLGGNSRSIMIANVSPGVEHAFHTYNTLNYATKSKKIVNDPQSSFKFVPPPEENVDPVTLKRRHSEEKSSNPSKKLKKRLSDPTRKQQLVKWKSISKASEKTDNKLSRLPTANIPSKKRKNMNGKENAVNSAILEKEIERKIARKFEKEIETLKKRNAVLSPLLRKQKRVNCETMHRLESLEKMILDQNQKSKKDITSKFAKKIPVQTITSKHKKISSLNKKNKKKDKKMKMKMKMKTNKKLEADDDDTSDEEFLPTDEEEVLSDDAATPFSRAEQAKEFIKKANAEKRAGRTEAALALFEKGLELVPENKRLQERVLKVRQQVREEQGVVNKTTMQQCSPPAQRVLFDNSGGAATDEAPPYLNAILDVLNNGTMKELLRMAEIGKKRAEQITLFRQAHTFTAIDELSGVGLSKKQIQSFVTKNTTLGVSTAVF